MALPKQIQTQVDEAEQAQKAAYESQATPIVDDQPVSNEVATAPVEAATNVVELPKLADKPVDKTEDVGYWKSRFDTVQGKLHAEIPQLHQQLREANQHNQQLLNRIEVLEKPAPAAGPDPLVDANDNEAFGEDMVTAIDRRAMAIAQKVIAAERAELERKFGAVETRVGEVANQVGQSSMDKFWDKVTQAVPEWSQIDQNPAWIAWLDTTPDYSELSYRTLASQAIQNGSVAKVAKLVDTWKKEAGQLFASASTAPSRQQSELSKQVGPSTVRSGSVPAAERMYTRAEYETLYDVRNVQRYGEKKANEMIAEADRAVADNRIRWT